MMGRFRERERERETERGGGRADKDMQDGGSTRAWRDTKCSAPQIRLRKRLRLRHALVQKLLAVGEQCLQAVQFRV